MKIIRAPLRVSLFGGGTDQAVYYEEHGATIISFALNRYMYITHNDRPTGGCRLSYSVVEELPTLADAKHTLVKAVARQYGFQEPCTLTITSDVPKGTGLGSSSALAVNLCALIGAPFLSVAVMAYVLERKVSPVGCQDHLPATYGGFRVYRIEKCGAVTHSPVPFGWEKMIEAFGLLLYTGQSRDANPILETWRKQDKPLREIQALADYVADAMDDMAISELVDCLKETWALKAGIGGVSNPTLNEQYSAALKAGALAGKLLGAGGGGCWFFLVPPRKRARVIEALGLVEIPFEIVHRGIEQWTL